MDDLARYLVGISSTLIIYSYIHVLVRLNAGENASKAMRLIIGIILNMYFVVCVITNQEPEWFVVACWGLLVLSDIVKKYTQKKL